MKHFSFTVVHSKAHAAPIAHAVPMAHAQKRARRFVPLFIMCSLLGVFMCASVFAQNSKTKKPSIDMQAGITYPSTAFPGDPVCVTISAPKNVQLTARARLKRDAGKIDTASESFYAHPTKRGAFLCLLPLDSTAKTGAYTLTVNGTVDGEPFQKTYAITVKEKSFVSETLHLDAVNTAIKTDTSTARKTQINRLNDILYTVNKDAFYIDAPFSYPVTSTRRTSFYGDRRIYAYSNGKSETSVHYGIDYGVPTGTAVRACGRGRVVLVENRVTTGHSVVIEHLPGLYSLYYHMSKTAVKEGDIVENQAFLGESGATGLATGPHLHWEIRLLGIAINPDFFAENAVF